MALKAILKAPLTFFKIAYKHLTKGPPRPTWSFPVHYGITVLRELMEDNKTSIKAARRYTEVSAPTSWNVRLTRTKIPRCSRVNVLQLLTPDQLTGYLKAEWVDYESDKWIKKQQRKRARQQNACKVCGKTRGGRNLVGGSEPQDLTDQVVHDKVVLYLHGGAYIICSPKTHRWMTWRLARNSNARVLAIYYRRAPEYTFPCALHDAISAYMYLIDPPAGSGAKKYNPSQIALAGDSAGGNMALALSLWLKRNGYPLPGAAALFSPWLDLTHSTPSYSLNGKYDYLPSEVADPKWLPRESRLNLPQSSTGSPFAQPRIPVSRDTEAARAKEASSTSANDVELPGVTVERTISSSKRDSRPLSNEPCIVESSSGEEEDFFHLIGTRAVDAEDLPMQLMHNTQYYAPDSLLTHPYISCVFGKPAEWQQVFSRMKTLVLVGDAERLYDESVVMLGRAAGAVAGDRLIEEPLYKCDSELDQSLKANFRVEVYEDGVHVVPLFFKSNLSRVCLRRAGKFLNSHLHYQTEFVDRECYFLSRVNCKNQVTPLSLANQLASLKSAAKVAPPEICVLPPSPVEV